MHEDEQHLLQVALDEGIHACDWDIDNDMVAEFAEDLAGYLWKLGFRHVREEGHGWHERGRESG